MTELFAPPRLTKHGHSEDRRVTWLELFYDLVYVAALIQLGNTLSEDVTAGGFTRFAILFALLWWAWTGITFYINRFIVDDVPHRLLIYLQMVGIAFMGVSVGGAFDDLSRQFALAYIFVRVVLALLYLRSWNVEKEVQPLIRMYVGSYALGIALWVISLFMPVSTAPILWGIAMLLEVIAVFLPRARDLQTRFMPHVHHLRERFGIFVIIVLGESFIKIITSTLKIAVNFDILLFSVLGIFVVFGLWWLYFSKMEVTEIRADHFAPYIWIYAHLPLTIGFTAFGVAAKKVFQSLGTDYVKEPYLLLYCASLLLTVLGASLVDLSLTRSGRFPRAAWYIFAAVALLGVMFLLYKPTALLFISIIAGLFAALVAGEALSKEKA
jgi:low temperature requirement protein LtrA